MTKYAPLTHHLRATNADRLPMTFAELEALLGFALPPSARKHRAWWANNPATHVNAAAWHQAGYQSQAVDLAAERLAFVKLNEVEAPRKPGRHPIFAAMKGMLWIEPGYDLTQPADPDWGEGKYDDFSVYEEKLSE